MTPPPLVLLEAYNGDAKAYLDALYALFLEQVANANHQFLGKRISLRKNPVTLGKGAGFWHLVSKDKDYGKKKQSPVQRHFKQAPVKPDSHAKEEEREIDLRRCETLPLIGHVLQNAHDKSIVRCWRNMRRGDANIVLELIDHNFIVILGHHEEYYLLRTAYTVSGTRNIAKLKAEFESSTDPRP